MRNGACREKTQILPEKENSLKMGHTGTSCVYTCEITLWEGKERWLMKFTSTNRNGVTTYLVLKAPGKQSVFLAFQEVPPSTTQILKNVKQDA